MNRSQIKMILLSAFVLATAYSFICLPGYSAIGGVCNAGAVIIFVGFFLIVCSILTLLSILNIIKADMKEQKSITGFILSIIALVIWCLLTIIFLRDNAGKALIYFTPNLLMTGITTFLSLYTNKKFSA